MVPSHVESKISQESVNVYQKQVTIDVFQSREGLISNLSVLITFEFGLLTLFYDFYQKCNRRWNSQIRHELY